METARKVNKLCSEGFKMSFFILVLNKLRLKKLRVWKLFVNTNKIEKKLCNYIYEIYKDKYVCDRVCIRRG